MVHIRLASEEDCSLIADYQIKMAMETENLQLNAETVSNGVMSVFRDSHKGKYIVADDNGKAVASMLLTYEWSDWRNSMVLWIQSVYVLPELRGKGIFRKMYDFVMEMASNDDTVSGIRLYVDMTNKNAMEAYRSVGMDGEHYKVFEWMK